MSDLKLTIDQLKNYLGTGLNMQYEGFGENREQIVYNWTISREEFLDINFKSEFSNNEEDVLFYFKPICYRLSDLDKFIPELGFVPAKELAKLITQAGYNAEKIQHIKNENNTITCIWPIQSLEHTESQTIAYQNFFEIDTDADFGFGIYYKKILTNGVVVEIESTTGNIWAMTKKLFEWHFWPFGDEYFEARLVIDKLLHGKEVKNE